MRAAFEAEASGYFLVLEKEEATSSWRTVSAGEAATLRGMGYTGNNG